MTESGIQIDRTNAGRLASNVPVEDAEGRITREIESFTSKIPSGTFLSLGFGAMALSALLEVMGDSRHSRFVGQWVPTILILGLYNKVVKIHHMH